MKPIFLLICILSYLTALTQSPCQPILSQAQAALNSGNTELALRKLQDVEICDDSNTLIRQRQRLQNAIFQLVNQQKQEAIDARVAVDEALKQVEKEKETTQLALNKAQKLIEAFYFYDDKFAVAYGESKIGGSRQANLFYFIDKNGDWVEKLSAWVKVEQFGEDGFSRVVGTDFYDRELACWLDTMGNYYPVAYQEEKMDERTMIADFSQEIVDLDVVIAKISQSPRLERLMLDGNKLEGDALVALLHELAKLDKFTHLSLQNCRLESLPAEIGQLTQLHTLVLINNELSTFPSEISQLQQLKVLNIDHNRFSSFPSVLTQLEQLEELTYYRNSFPPLSPEIFEIKNLTELVVSIEAIKTIPSAIGQLTKLKKIEIFCDSLTELPPELFQLTQLEVLFINGGNIKILPPEIGRLTALENLTIRGNRITNIPASISDLTDLNKLWLDDNALKKIPIEIGQLEQLESISLSHNQLEELPPEIGQLKHLSTLWLSDNKLTNLPASISELKQLVFLQLENNKLKTLAVDWSNLNGLRQLFLGENPLAELPKGIEQLPLLQNLNLMGTNIVLEEVEALRAVLPDCHISPEESDLKRHYRLSKNYAALFALEKENTITRNSRSSFDWHNISFYALFAGEYETAKLAAQRTLELDPSEAAVATNLALAYLLNDEWPEAETIYLSWKDKKFPDDSRMAKEVFLKDIGELEAAGITHPDFAKVRALLEGE